jgi:hypothetical protein
VYEDVLDREAPGDLELPAPSLSRIRNLNATFDDGSAG